MMDRFSVLPPSFFQYSATTVAKQLLGKQLVREYPDGTMTSLPIQEVEAYDGFRDLANHATKRRTPSNEIMFAVGGYFYAYWCYGIHLMLNVVCGEQEYPAAVLIRGAGNIAGPGKLTKFLQLDKSLNGKEATPETGLWFVEAGIEITESEMVMSPRIGISEEAGEWQYQPLRFLWQSSTS